MASQRGSIVRFDDFEMDLHAGELRKGGQVVSLPPQPFKVLSLLVRRTGELVTRDEIRQEIWGDQTAVDFERGLNFAINKIRSALGESAEAARYVETLPRRGYRFLRPVETAPESLPAETIPVETVQRRKRRLIPALGGGLVLLLLGGYLGAQYWRASGRIRSIAVLPFENLSHDAADDYLADGTTEALITDLGRVSTLPVTSKTSSGRYRKSAKTLTEIARELKAGAIVEGAVLRSGDRLRVSVQLIDAGADRQIWSDSYDRRLGDVLTLQGEIAAAIAEAIRARVTPEQKLELTRPRPVNPEAYQLYVRGRFFWNKATADGSRRAIADFEQALTFDPHFALAYAGLADAYAGLPVFLGTPAAEAYSKAKKAADRALAIDPNLVEAVNVLAEVAEYSWNWREAERLFQRVFRMNPSYAQAYHDYGFYLIAMGRVKDATLWTEKACMLDPLSVYYASDLALDPYLLRDYEEAIRQLNRVLAMDPQYATTHLYLALPYAAKRDYDRAIASAQKSFELDSENPFNLSTLAYVYGQAGKLGAARQTLERLTGMSRRQPVSAFHFGLAYLGMGDHERAINSFLKAYEERFYVLILMKTMPAFDPLRADPRFQELLSRMGIL